MSSSSDPGESSSHEVIGAAAQGTAALEGGSVEQGEPEVEELEDDEGYDADDALHNMKQLLDVLEDDGFDE